MPVVAWVKGCSGLTLATKLALRVTHGKEHREDPRPGGLLTSPSAKPRPGID